MKWLMISFLVFIAAKAINAAISTEDMHEKQRLDFNGSFIRGLALIFISELGDKTFFLTMIYAATNNFFKTFIVTSITMLAMNLLALLVGFYLPIFVYRDYIDWLAIIVFTVFGILMLWDAYHMENKPIIHEYEEVRNEMIRKNSSASHDARKVDMERADLKQKLIEKENYNTNNANNNASFTSIFAYIASLIVAEIGDKSQISAIILGAIHNFYGVLIGTSLGFVACILTAIIAGNVLAKTLTTKQLTYVAGIMFLIFAGAYLYEKYD